MLRFFVLAPPGAIIHHDTAGFALSPMPEHSEHTEHTLSTLRTLSEHTQRTLRDHPEPEFTQRTIRKHSLHLQSAPTSPDDLLTFLKRYFQSTQIKTLASKNCVDSSSGRRRLGSTCTIVSCLCVCVCFCLCLCL